MLPDGGAIARPVAFTSTRSHWPCCASARKIAETRGAQRPSGTRDKDQCRDACAWRRRPRSSQNIRTDLGGAYRLVELITDRSPSPHTADPPPACRRRHRCLGRWWIDCAVGQQQGDWSLAAFSDGADRLSGAAGICRPAPVRLALANRLPCASRSAAVEQTGSPATSPSLRAPASAHSIGIACSARCSGAGHLARWLKSGNCRGRATSCYRSKLRLN